MCRTPQRQIIEDCSSFFELHIRLILMISYIHKQIYVNAVDAKTHSIHRTLI